MKEARPFEGIVSDKSSAELSEQERLLSLKLECGTKKQEEKSQEALWGPST